MNRDALVQALRARVPNLLAVGFCTTAGHDYQALLLPIVVSIITASLEEFLHYAYTQT